VESITYVDDSGIKWNSCPAYREIFLQFSGITWNFPHRSFLRLHWLQSIRVANSDLFEWSRKRNEDRAATLKPPGLAINGTRAFRERSVGVMESLTLKMQPAISWAVCSSAPARLWARVDCRKVSGGYSTLRGRSWMRSSNRGGKMAVSVTPEQFAFSHCTWWPLSMRPNWSFYGYLVRIVVLDVSSSTRWFRSSAQH